MAVRLARSLTASSLSRPSFLSHRNRESASEIASSAINGGEFSNFGRSFAFYSSSSSSWCSFPEDLTEGSKRREKKTITDRFSAVIDAVHDRKLPPELRGRRDFVRSETDIINVVEQRIWHSMEEGQFENLAGKGKPLNHLHANPHADPAEDTLYRILNKNGFAPEWVELNKEIRNKAKEWRFQLKKAWSMKKEDQSEWEERSTLLKTELKQINNMVFRYNLIVPFGRQMFGLKWDKEMDRLNEEHL